MPTYLITGANRGIGLAFARQGIAAGATVIGTARDPDAASELRDLGARVEQLDVADPASVKALGERLAAEPIDRLVNNAAVFLDKQMKFETITADALNNSFHVNATGPLLVTQALLPSLEKGTGKQVAQISSDFGSLTQAHDRNDHVHFAYRASKSALNMINTLMSNALRDRGIACVTIHPGWVQTDMGGPDAQLDPNDVAKRIYTTLDRFGPDDTGRFIDLDGKDMPW